MLFRSGMKCFARTEGCVREYERLCTYGNVRLEPHPVLLDKPRDVCRRQSVTVIGSEIFESLPTSDCVSLSLRPATHD